VDADPSVGRPVLVVDDDPDLRMSIVLLLRLSGIPVAEAADGGEALAYLRSHPPPRLILLDLVMRGMDGLAFRQAQLGDPGLADIPVAVCTAQEDYRGHAAFRGVVAFLVKPVNPLRLLGLVREFRPPTQGEEARGWA
jgi:CheY-like chemotaxis protein